jgi:hypothetical protein
MDSSSNMMMTPFLELNVSDVSDTETVTTNVSEEHQSLVERLIVKARVYMMMLVQESYDHRFTLYRRYDSPHTVYINALEVSDFLKNGSTRKNRFATTERAESLKLCEMMQYVPYEHRLSLHEDCMLLSVEGLENVRRTARLEIVETPGTSWVLDIVAGEMRKTQALHPDVTIPLLSMPALNVEDVMRKQLEQEKLQRVLNTEADAEDKEVVQMYASCHPQHQVTPPDDGSDLYCEEGFDDKEIMAMLEEKRKVNRGSTKERIY